jgi:hypothetical protein
MRLKKEVIILVLLIGVLSGYLVVQKRGQTHYTLPELGKIDATAVSKLVIKQGETKTTLVREEGRWLILPERYPADPALVTEMVDGVGALSLTALASESRKYALYELEDAEATEVTLYNGDAPVRRILIGKGASSGRHSFVRLDTDHRVFHASGVLGNRYRKTVADLRDKSVLAIDEEITEVTLQDGAAQLVIMRHVPSAEVQLGGGPADAGQAAEKAEGPPPPKWQTADGVPAREHDIDEIIRSVSHLRCDGFVEGKGKEAFTAPRYTLTLKGSRSYSLAIFEKDENRFVATSSGSDYPFLISDWKAEKIMKELRALVATEDAESS